MKETDMISEAAVGFLIKKVPYTAETKNGVRVWKAELSQEDAKRYGRRAGKYFSAESDRVDALIETLAEGLCSLLEKRKNSCVLVTGLGNEDIVCDALGSESLKFLKVSDEGEFHVFASQMRLCALAPSVSFFTGMESAEIVKAVCERLNPCAVIAIDALCTADPKKLGNSFQITDAGIRPGSALGKGKELCKQYLGVTVIGMGVPLVLKWKGKGSQFLLTSKNAQAMVNKCAEIIGKSINKAMEEME